MHTGSLSNDLSKIHWYVVNAVVVTVEEGVEETCTLDLRLKYFSGTRVLQQSPFQPFPAIAVLGTASLLKYMFQACFVLKEMHDNINKYKMLHITY